MPSPLISISVVSHGQLALVEHLLLDIDRHCGDDVELLLTENIDEQRVFESRRFRFPIRVIRNAVPKGFGANHNTAFTLAKGRYFAIVNPDIKFSNNPFSALIACLKDRQVGIVAPLVVNSEGEIEDSARRYPTPIRILARVLRRKHEPDYAVGSSNVSPDWVAGMFMLIPASVFRSLGGFDERYFLYCEDVDLCGRARLAGYDVMLCPNSRVVHEARRQSHRDWKYLRWHVSSIIKFFFSRIFFALLWRRRPLG